MLPSWYIPEGGQFCRNQAQVLCKKGLNVNVLANVSISWKKYKFQSFIFPWKTFASEEDGLLVLRKFTRTFPFFRRLNGLIWSWRTLKAFDKYVIIYGKPDLIHVHSVLWGGYAAYLIQKKRGVPYIITEHKGIFGESCDYAKKQFEKWQTPFMEKAFSNAKTIVLVSNNLRPKINTYLTSNVPFLEISNVVDTDFYYLKERKIGEDIKIVAVNCFLFVKAYDILLPAFDKVCDETSNVRLKIVGEYFERSEFQEIWTSIIHKDKISFSGELDSFGVREELWNANIFVISSRVESQSVSTLEALSTGLPIVCTTVIPKKMANNETAIVVPVEDIDALADGIIKMAKNFRNYDNKMISDSVKNYAGKDVISAKLIELYSQILSQ